KAIVTDDTEADRVINVIEADLRSDREGAERRFAVGAVNERCIGDIRRCKRVRGRNLDVVNQSGLKNDARQDAAVDRTDAREAAAVAAAERILSERLLAGRAVNRIAREIAVVRPKNDRRSAQAVAEL